jgi:Holliday junction resolvase RusA-like endonuclease
VIAYAFSLFGEPGRQGDMKAQVVSTKPPIARIYNAEGDDLRRWRKSVADACSDAMLDHEAARIEKPRPVELTITWQFVYRKADLTAAGDPKDGAPRFKVSWPDIDKLERAMLDALTGVAYADDAQVARVVKEKVYGRTFHTTVQVRELP